MFSYFTPFFFAILFVYWFHDSVLAEIFWALLYVIGYLCSVMYNQIQLTKNEYIDFARSLVIPKSKIYSSVVWKSCQSDISKTFPKLHFNLWILILVYEYISSSGLGNIFKLVISYNDFSGLVVIGIILSVLIFLGNIFITHLNKKLVFWES